MAPVGAARPPSGGDPRQPATYTGRRGSPSDGDPARKAGVFRFWTHVPGGVKWRFEIVAPSVDYIGVNKYDNLLLAYVSFVIWPKVPTGALFA